MTVDHDYLVEKIARGIEERSFLDLAGVLSRRKRDRERAEFRMHVREDYRREMADFVRAFKVEEGRDPLVELGRLSENGGTAKYNLFRDIADLVDMGFVDAEALVALTGNSIPASARFIATITKNGRKALAERCAELKGPPT